MGQVCEVDHEIIAIEEFKKNESVVKMTKPAIVQAEGHEVQKNVAHAVRLPDAERQKRQSFQGKAILLEEPLSLSDAVRRRLDELGAFKFPGSDTTVTYNSISQVYLLNNGIRYVGQWEEGDPHGNGIFVLPDGSYLEGTITEGKVNGKGRIINSNGDYYEGDFKNNRAEGQGRYQEGDVIYQGEFSENLPHGQGVETGKDFQFVGQFADGTRKQGKLVWKDQFGTFSYQGSFSQNIFNGTGSLKDQRRTFSGLFDNGKQIKEFKLESPYD